jgi:hypothetical protein
VKIWVAFKTADADGDLNPPERFASANINQLRQQMKGLEDASGRKLKGLPRVGDEFTVALFDIKPSLPILCQVITDITQIKVDAAMYFRIDEKRMLREVEG